MGRLPAARVSFAVLMFALCFVGLAALALAGDPPDDRPPIVHPDDIRHYPSTLELQIDPGKIDEVLKQAAIQVEMRVVALRINGGATLTDSRSVVLNPEVWWTGIPPTHYRASEDEAGLAQGEWIYMGNQRLLPFELSAGESIKTIYFQVGLPQLGENWRSDVVSESILFKLPAEPTATSIYTYNFAEAYAMALNNGFEFSGEPMDATSNCIIEVPQNHSELHLVAWGDTGLGSRCNFTVFGGRNLADGWSFVNDEVGGYCQGGRTISPRPETRDSKIEYQAHLWTEGLLLEDMDDYLSGNFTDDACYTVFVRLVLEGPAGASHIDAFH